MAAYSHICQRLSLRGRGPGLRASLRYAITAGRRTSQSRAGLIPSMVPNCSSRVSCRFDSPLSRDASATVTYSSSGNQPSWKCDRRRQYTTAQTRMLTLRQAPSIVAFSARQKRRKRRRRPNTVVPPRPGPIVARNLISAPSSGRTRKVNEQLRCSIQARGRRSSRRVIGLLPKLLFEQQAAVSQSRAWGAGTPPSLDTPTAYIILNVFHESPSTSDDLVN